jgi:hypothetical protein
MKSFKECLSDDLNAFLNLKEFAETHQIDGVDVDLVIDDDQFSQRERMMSAEMFSMTQGIFNESKTFYVRASDMDKPAPREKLSLDGKDYTVNAATEENGLISVQITANRS